MGYKSRTNWNVLVCLKTDCINRNIECKNCLRFNKYKKEIKDDRK